MIAPLRLGTARVDITPQYPVLLAGFAHRSGLFERIHSPLFLRALLFSQDDTHALLISADLFCWGPDLCATVYESLSRRLGIPPESVILHATHNHSGPQTSHLFSLSLGAADDRYLDFLQDAVVRAAESASGTLEPVTVERGAGRCGFGIHRRRLVDGVIQMAPNADGPVDPELTVIRFRALDGAAKALLAHYTCHPTVSGTNEVCAEYPGLAMTALEQDTPLVAAFLQGCCGDIRPALIRDDEFYRGDPRDAAVFAADLARETCRVVTSEMAPCAACALAVSRRKTSLPAAGSPVLESTRLDLAQDVGLLSFNAEMVVAYGFYTKERSRGKLIPVGYTNGMIGYVPTRRQIEEGGYESAEAFRYYGLPTALSGASEEVVMEHIRQVASLTGCDKRFTG